MGKIFTPLQIGNLTVKNRIMMSPMENGMAHAGGRISDRLIAFFVERARNEVGIIMTGSVAVAPEGAGLPAQIAVYDDQFVPGLTRLCEQVHAAGAKIGAQIYHAGRQATEATTGLQPVAPSALPCPLLGNNPRALSPEELPGLVNRFAEGARRVVEAGFDLIEVHFAHGYLLASFLSPLSNKRTDVYGGSLENRCRFPLAVLKEVVRVAAGKVPVTIRISVSEFLDEGLQFEEVQQIGLMAQQAGAQAVSITAGCYESVHTSIQPMFVPQGFLIPYAQELKQMLAVPVIVAGRLNNARLLEECVESGQADMVAIGRGLIADSRLAVKLKEGREGEIRYCVACNQGCCDSLFRGGSIACMLNAQASFEAERPLVSAAVPQRIVIVGAGPAGMEAARVAAERGHDVTLCEGRALGGKFSLLAAPPEKDTFLLFDSYLKGQLARLGVRVVKHHVTSPEDLRDFAPDHVILATGARQTSIPVPGADLPSVIMAEEILSGQRLAGDRAIIIGGGLVGIETSHFLAERGVQVSIVEKMDGIAKEAGATYVGHIQEMLQHYGITVMTGAQITRILPEGVEVNQRLLPADTVILAAGYSPDQSLKTSMEKAYGNVHLIGDARKPGNILQAVHDAFLCAASL